MCVIIIYSEVSTQGIYSEGILLLSTRLAWGLLILSSSRRFYFDFYMSYAERQSFLWSYKSDESFYIFWKNFLKKFFETHLNKMYWPCKVGVESNLSGCHECKNTDDAQVVIIEIVVRSIIWSSQSLGESIYINSVGYPDVIWIVCEHIVAKNEVG